MNVPARAGWGWMNATVPLAEPGTRQARKVLAGIAIAGIGSCVIAAMR
jgi:hypothetical protein